MHYKLSLISNNLRSCTTNSHSCATIHAHALQTLTHTSQFTLMHYKLSLIRYNLRSCTTNSRSYATIYAHALQSLAHQQQFTLILITWTQKTPLKLECYI